MITVGKKIRYLRKQQHMTQKQLGLAVGFSEFTADIRIAQYESGARAPKAQLLHRIASILEVGPIVLSVHIPETEEEWEVIGYWINRVYSSGHHKNGAVGIDSPRLKIFRFYSKSFWIFSSLFCNSSAGSAPVTTAYTFGPNPSSCANKLKASL